MADKETERARELVDIDDNIVFCRARGFLGGHDWPKLTRKRGRLLDGQLPKGFRPVLQHDGTVLMEEICGNCGKKRWWETGQGGVWNPGAKRHYVDPPNWKVIPAELGYTSRDFDAEAYNRLKNDIMAAARKAAIALQQEAEQQQKGTVTEIGWKAAQ